MNYAARAREAMKLTQAEMAEALGVSQPTISRIESMEELAPKDRLAIRGLLANKRIRVTE